MSPNSNFRYEERRCGFNTQQQSTTAPGRDLQAWRGPGAQALHRPREAPPRPYSPTSAKEGSYLRLIDSCITQLEDSGPSRTCNQSKDEKRREHICQRDQIAFFRLLICAGARRNVSSYKAGFSSVDTFAGHETPQTLKPFNPSSFFITLQPRVECASL